MIAGVLCRLGVVMGTRMLGRTEFNPLGHFEDTRFVELNDRILAAAGGDWLHAPTTAAILAQESLFQAEIQTVLDAAPAKVWGWKDPRTCLTLDLFYPHLTNPRFIVCHRESGAVAASLSKRDGMPLAQGQALKEIYDRRIEAFFATHPGLPRLDLHYQATLHEPEYSVRRICEFLALEINTSTYRKSLAMIISNDRLQKRAASLRQKRRVRRLVRDLVRRVWR